MENEVISYIGDSIHSIISEGTRLSGELHVKGLLRIDGDLLGNISSDGKILVSKNGRAQCTINGNVVVIGGIVQGNIFATKSVEILSSGVVIGNIVTPRLMIHEDVIFHGTCRVASPELLAGRQLVEMDDVAGFDKESASASCIEIHEAASIQ
jgi:cytoskeletal protein CcmA (bactofilin family)